MAVTLEELQLQITANHNELTAGLNRAQQRVDNFTARTTKSFTLLKTVVAGVFASQLLRSVVDAADKMQRLDARLLATTGSASAAGEAMDFLRKTAEKQSVNVLDLADGYNRLLPSVKSNIISMEDMRTILTLANDNIKAFGLSTSETQGLFLGLSQALGSGTVTMEDLRQVTDRLPGSLNAIAKASNLSVNEFKKLIATGGVTADMIKGPLIEAFKKNEGAAESMANTYSSAVTRMKNAGLELSDSIGEAGLTGAMANAATNIAIVTKLITEAVNEVNEWNEAVNESQQETIDFFETQRKLQEDSKKAGILGFESTDQMKEAAGILKEMADSFKEMGENPIIGPLEMQGPKLPKITPPTPELKPEEEAFQAQLEIKVAQNKKKEALEEEHQNTLNNIIAESQNNISALTSKWAEQSEVIDKLSAKKKLAVTASSFSDLLSMSASHNKALFELNKVATIAKIALNTPETISDAYKWGTALGGPPLGAAFAVTAGAAQLAQLSAASSQQFGGGGSAGGGGGAIASSAASTTAPQQQAIQQNVQDVSISVTGGGQIDGFALIQAINEAQGDGATLIRNVSIS